MAEQTRISLTSVISCVRIRQTTIALSIDTSIYISRNWCDIGQDIGDESAQDQFSSYALEKAQMEFLTCQ